MGSCLCRGDRHINQHLPFLWVYIAEELTLIFIWDTKWVKQQRAHHQLSLCVTLIMTTIAIILRLLQQEHSVKQFPYIVLANPHENHGKQILSFLYSR